MTDITMCKSRNCPLRETCYRYTAAPNPYRQAYFTNEPIKELHEGFWDCDQWIDNKGKPK